MVGRLVQKKDIRSLQKQAGQLGPLSPATAQDLKGLIKILVTKSQTVQDLFRLVLRAVTETLFQFLLPGGKPVQCFPVSGIYRFFPLLPEGPPVRQHLQHISHKGPVQLNTAQLLLHVPDPCSPGISHLAFLRDNPPGHYIQQGGLAAAVGPGHHQLHPRIKLQIEIGEQIAAVKTMRDRSQIQAQHIRRSPPNLSDAV